MKATKPKLVAVLIAVVVIATASLYLVKFLANYSAKTPLSHTLSAGIDLFHKKQYKDAQANLEQCYQKAPQGDLKNRALLFLSRCCTAQKQTQKAAEFWGKVVQNPAMQSHHAEALYSIAQLRAAGGTPDDLHAARDYYKKAAATTPRSRFGDLAQIAIASLIMDNGDLREARHILNNLRDEKKDYPQLRKALFKLNMKLLFSPIITQVPESLYYAVQQGDTLTDIAKKFHTTADLLQESNGVDPRRLQIGKRLKVVTGKFRLKISKSNNILQLLSGDVVLNEYRIGTGRFGSTPVGKFKIVDKVKEPPWFRDGRVIPYGHPENVLGTRWMKIQSTDGQNNLTGYGIHGTDDASSIGKESSQGCIRLLNRDVEELFKIVPLQTEVVIEE